MRWAGAAIRGCSSAPSNKASVPRIRRPPAEGRRLGARTLHLLRDLVGRVRFGVEAELGEPRRARHDVFPFELAEALRELEQTRDLSRHADGLPAPLSGNGALFENRGVDAG